LSYDCPTNVLTLDATNITLPNYTALLNGTDLEIYRDCLVPVLVSTTDLSDLTCCPIVGTWAEIEALRSASLLEVGRIYSVTDFYTLHQVKDGATGLTILNDDPSIPVSHRAIDTANPGNTREQLTITARAVDAFGIEAISTQYPTDIIEYEFNDSTGIAPRGRIIYRKSTNDGSNQEANRDIRQCITTRWEDSLGSNNHIEPIFNGF